MCKKALTVTIDGPAGVGKSTIAKCLAEDLGIAYLDTGAMFRTVALKAANAETKEQENITVPEDVFRIVFSLEGTGNKTALLCNGVTVGAEIRSEKAGMMAARIAASPDVREWLKQEQQRLASLFSLVAEGRDMGTVVFPNAPYKFFLDASPKVRAERRFLQLKAMGQEADLQEITRQIEQRDFQDRNRAVAPLKAAKDAILIDTSSKSLEEVFQTIRNYIKQ